MGKIPKLKASIVSLIAAITSLLTLALGILLHALKFISDNGAVVVFVPLAGILAVISLCNGFLALILIILRKLKGKPLKKPRIWLIVISILIAVGILLLLAFPLIIIIFLLIGGGIA